MLNCPSSYVLSEQGFNVIVTSSSDKVYNVFNGPVWTHRTLLIQYLQLSTTIILSCTLFITSTASGAVGVYNWGNRPSPCSFSTVPLLSNSVRHPDILSILPALDVPLAISPWCPSSFRERD